MSEILFHYHRVHPATWAYLSSLLTIALYFKFSRFWSVRNLDLVLLILLAPGLLIANYGREIRLNATLAGTLASTRPSAQPPPDPVAGDPSAISPEALRRAAIAGEMVADPASPALADARTEIDRE